MRDRKIIVIVILIICLLLSLAITIYNMQWHERDSPVDINSCSVQSLIDLPGIGEILARRIIESRPYENIDQLKDIPGIGTVRFNLIESKVVTK